MTTFKTVDQLFNLLWYHYIAKMPQAGKVVAVLENMDEPFFNDHVAFRTLGLDGLGISMLEQIFFNLGYKRMDYMNFADKKLNAYWYLPPDLKLPKVFISELRIQELSPASQALIAKYTTGVNTAVSMVDYTEPKSIAPMLSTHARPWNKPSYADYQQLSQESEYAAWTLAFGNELNHFTIAVNFLKKIPAIQTLNDLLEKNGITLNDAGGKIKGTPNDLLVQSSTVADQVDYKFSDGVHRIPYSYLEFAERFYRDPASGNGIRDSKIPYAEYYQGFVPGNADKIFESTFQHQAKKLGSTS